MILLCGDYHFRVIVHSILTTVKVIAFSSEEAEKEP